MDRRRVTKPAAKGFFTHPLACGMLTAVNQPGNQLAVAFSGRCLTNHLARSGIGVYAHELARFLTTRLPPERLKILIPAAAAAPAGIDPSYLQRVPRSLGERLSRRYLMGEFFGQIALLQAARRLFPRGVTFVPDAPAWSPLRPRRLVVTCYDLIHHGDHDTNRSAIQKIRLILGDRFTQGADRILTISEHVRDEIVSVWPHAENRIRVVYPLACADTTAQAHRQTESAASIAGRLPPAPYWVYFGGYNPRKDVPFLFEAHAEVGRRLGRPAPPLVAVGLVHGAGALRRDAGIESIPPGVIGLPQLSRSDLMRVVSGAALCPYPSRNEGFGLPPYEAMLRGVPVLVGDNTSLREVVPDPRCRRPAGDREAWVDALCEAVANPERFRCPCPPTLERNRNEEAFLRVLEEVQLLR